MTIILGIIGIIIFFSMVKEAGVYICGGVVGAVFGFMSLGGITGIVLGFLVGMCFVGKMIEG